MHTSKYLVFGKQKMQYSICHLSLVVLDLNGKVINRPPLNWVSFFVTKTTFDFI